MTYQKALEAAKFLKSKLERPISLALVLGSGSDKIIERFEIRQRWSFGEVPHLQSSTFHKGEVLIAHHQGKDILILSGRLHYYEGFTMDEITFPIRILSLLDITEILMTNAAGGLNPDYTSGEIVLINDHINLLGENPLRGANDDRFGVRFPDMSEAYSSRIRHKIQLTHNKKNTTPLREGVYAAFMGPSLETPAEYKYLHLIGADLVGMSTVPEVIVANHCGIEIGVISIVTNLCYPPEIISKTTVEQVIETVNRKLPDLCELFFAYLESSQ